MVKHRNLFRRPDKEGGTWWIDYRKDGNRLRQSLQTKLLREAKRRRDDIIEGKVGAKWGDDITGDITPEAFWKKYLEWAVDHKQPRSIERETLNWEQFLDFVKPETLGAVTRQDVERFKKHCSKSSITKIVPSTIAPHDLGRCIVAPRKSNGTRATTHFTESVSCQRRRSRFAS